MRGGALVCVLITDEMGVQKILYNIAIRTIIRRFTCAELETMSE